MRTLVHEMRNQLTVAVVNIEAFIDGKLEPTPRRLGAVLQALNELDVLMNDLDSHSQVAPMSSERRTIDMYAVISNELLAVEAAANRRDVTFQGHHGSSSDPAGFSFSGDPHRIGQVVKNLLLNAIRYTRPGGRITVDCFRDRECLTFTVANEGAGIAAEDFGHIFEPGFRCSATAAAPGTGLGLTVAKRIVEDHGGTISVASTQGKGALFTVRLPDESSGACSVG